MYAPGACLIETVLPSLHVVLACVLLWVETQNPLLFLCVASFSLIEVKSGEAVSRLLARCEACVYPQLPPRFVRGIPAGPLNTWVQPNIVLTHLILSKLVLRRHWVEEEARI